MAQLQMSGTFVQILSMYPECSYRLSIFKRQVVNVCMLW